MKANRISHMSKSTATTIKNQVVSNRKYILQITVQQSMESKMRREKTGHEYIVNKLMAQGSWCLVIYLGHVWMNFAIKFELFQATHIHIQAHRLVKTCPALICTSLIPNAIKLPIF